MIDEKPHYTDVISASNNISGVLSKTKLLSSCFGETLGLDLRLKPECRQITGSFKIRGAANKLLKRSSQVLPWTQIVTASSGNHGAAVAYVAQLMGIPAKIVVPENANQQKIAVAIGYGAQIVYHGLKSEERRNKANAICSEIGGIFVHSHDDAAVIAGQGTIAKEIVEEFPDVEAIVVPVGGGGLLAGVSLVREKYPGIAVVGVEPTTSAGTLLSLQKGTITAFPQVNTIADGLRAEKPGKMNFQIIKEKVDEIVTVSDAEIFSAVFSLLEKDKILVEPSGATAFAAVFHKKLSSRYKKIAVVLSGGNVSLSELNYLDSQLQPQKQKMGW